MPSTGFEGCPATGARFIPAAHDRLLQSRRIDTAEYPSLDS